MTRAQDITGNRYDRVIVLSRIGTISGHARWRCLCDCGEHIEANGSDLKRGAIKSCGCLKREQMAMLGLRQVHGHASHKQKRSPTYISWRAMIQRCNGLYEGHKANRYYRDRGITVCERWRTFENFLADMGVRPTGTTIDRIDNNINYVPGNCRWATPHEQRINQRRSAMSLTLSIVPSAEGETP